MRARAWAVPTVLTFDNWDSRRTKSIVLKIQTNKKNVAELFRFIRDLKDPRVVANTRTDDKEIEITLQKVKT